MDISKPTRLLELSSLYYKIKLADPLVFLKLLKLFLLIFTAIVVNQPLIACVLVAEEEITSIQNERLRNHLNLNIDSSHHIDEIKKYGSAFDIYYKPHKASDGFIFKRYLSCYQKNDFKYECEELEEIKSILIESPVDHINVSGEISSEDVLEVISFLKSKILLDDNMYSYQESDKKLYSDKELDINEIEAVSEFEYLIDVESGGTCASHRIVIRKVQCTDADGRCEYRLIENELSHFL